MGPVPEFVEETVVSIGYFCFGVFDLYFIGFVCYLSFIENPVLEKSVTLPFSNAVGFPIVPIGPIVPINYDGFGKFIFFLELGLKLISGKKDSPVFYILYTFYGFSNLSVIVEFSAFIGTGDTYDEFFFFNLLRSNPPPVIKSFLAFLYCYYLSFAYYCYLRCFFNAYYALLCVYFLLYYYYYYFLSFSSANLCLSSSAFLLLSSYFNNFYCLFLDYNYFYLYDICTYNSSYNIIVSSIII